MSKDKIEHALPIGTVLKNGMYTVTSVIGSGGFGITYMAVQKPDTVFGDSKKVVIKELFIAPNTANRNCIRDTNNRKTVHPSGGLSQDFDYFKRKFKAEAETLHRFRSYEGMVQVLDYFEENNTVYFIMHYIESMDLHDVVKSKGRLPLKDALDYINQVGTLVQKLHGHKVLHRDIKPQNILIDKSGKAFLIDFGISKAYDNLDVVSKITGTYTDGYSPPEQMASIKNLISAAMDVHALAATFYFCVTGQHPPKLQDRNLGVEVTVSNINTSIPKAIDQVIGKAMAIRPQDRTQTVIEFLNEMNIACGGKGITIIDDGKTIIDPPPPPQPPPQPSSTSKWIYYLLGGIALAIAVGVFISKNNQYPVQNEVNKNTQTNTSQEPSSESPELAIQKRIISEIRSNMVRVEGGSYMMGCTDEQGQDCYDDEIPAIEKVVGTFYISNIEVTQQQYKAIMGKNPSYYKHCDRCPVETVSWYDANEFIKRLNKLSGESYRLPSSVEWEYAARGGKKSNSYKYSGSNEIGDVAWYDVNSGKKTHEVGGKYSNESGLFDMSGNVREWCSDHYSKDYSWSRKSTSLEIRGGSWGGFPRHCRVAYRNGSDPSYGSDNIGFRLCRT